MPANYKKGQSCLSCKDSNEWLWNWYAKGKGNYCCKKCNSNMPKKKPVEDDGLFTWEDYEKD